MAKPIEPTPVLKGKDAERFIKQMMAVSEARKKAGGEYDCYLRGQDGYDTDIDVANGEPFFIVVLEDGTEFDVKSQAEAEILSRLVRIELMLKKLGKA